MFRRRRRHEATAEQSSPGVDEQPFWLVEKGAQPDRVLVSPRIALLRYDSPPWLVNQELRRHHRERSYAASPLRGVSTQEVLAALGDVFSPAELDWELVGVVFVPYDPSPALPVDVMLEAPPWASEAREDPEAIEIEVPEPAPVAAPTPLRPTREWLPEHEEIMATVRGLPWEAYRSLIADVFRRDGYEVFEGEGPDGDVIDMEVLRGAERMLVNCQLRGLDQVGVEPLEEMEQVGLRNGADGVFIVSDGEFAPEAWAFADGRALVLIDRETLLDVVLEVTLGAGRERRMTTRVRRFLSGLKPPKQFAS
jgi:restriction endonuclease